MTEPNTLPGEVLEAAAGSDAAVIADLGAQAMEPHLVELEGHEPFLAAHLGGRLVTKGLEEFAEAPYRQRGAFVADTPQGFVDYVLDHRQPGTGVFLRLQPPSVHAVLDGHTAGRNAVDAPEVPGSFGGLDDAGHGEHTATLQFLETPDWQAWVSNSGKLMPQVRFAEFIEDHAGVIIEPTAADMLEVATTFEARKSVEFVESTRLTSSTRGLTYKETSTAKAGEKGHLEVPEFIRLLLQPFRGAPTYEVRARFRYKIEDGKLAVGYVLDRPDKVLEAAVTDAHLLIKEGVREAGVRTYEGAPPTGARL